jgi:glycosyltransferase involved in cell wall biosynthesis
MLWGMLSTPLDNLSVSIVCKDNAATIGRTLESVKGLAGEIVAVDSGSTDGTIEMLEAAGARVIRSAWMGHVKTKQFALEQCSREWVLCIDSDESLGLDLLFTIRDIVESRATRLHEFDGFEVRRVTHYKGSPLRYVWQPEYRLRLVRRGKARWGGFDPHDKLEMTGGAPFERLWMGPRDVPPQPDTFFIRHDSFPTFTEHMRKQWYHSTTMARSLHEAGVKGSYVRLVCSPAGAMFKQLVMKLGFLDGYAGWLAAASTAVGAMVKHAALIEMDHAGDSKTQ